MIISLYNDSTKQEGSFLSKTMANLTHCSRWPSTPPFLLHDPASQTVTFSQRTQPMSQLHTTTASTTRYVLGLLLNHHPLYTNITCTNPPSPAHSPLEAHNNTYTTHLSSSRHNTCITTPTPNTPGMTDMN